MNFLKGSLLLLEDTGITLKGNHTHSLSFTGVYKYLTSTSFPEFLFKILIFSYHFILMIIYVQNIPFLEAYSP